jgi:hypothetical protein
VNRSWFVDFLAVGDAGDIHPLFSVINRIDDAVIADPETPAILIPVQFVAAGRPGIKR